MWKGRRERSMMKRTVWLVSGAGLLLMGAVVWYGLSLNSDSAVGKLSAAASAAAAVGGTLAFLVLVIYTAETSRLRKATENQLHLQQQVQEDQVKLSLFDKRFLIYSGVDEFVMSILRNNGVNMMSDDYRRFADRVGQAEWLFRADVNNYLAEIKTLALYLHPRCIERDHKSAMHQDISALSHEITEAMMNLSGPILERRNSVFRLYHW